MKVYIVADSKGRACYIASSLAAAYVHRLRLDLTAFAILEWTVDETEFFGRQVAHGVKV